MIKFGISLYILLSFMTVQAELTVEGLQKQGLVYYSEYELFEVPYYTLVQTVKGEHQISIQSEGQKLFTGSSSSVSEGFKEIEYQSFDGGEKVYAIIRKQKGVHGELIQIISLADKKEVFLATSAWPLTYEVKDGSVVVNVVDEERKSSQKIFKGAR